MTHIILSLFFFICLAGTGALLTAMLWGERLRIGAILVAGGSAAEPPYPTRREVRELPRRARPVSRRAVVRRLSPLRAAA